MRGILNAVTELLLAGSLAASLAYAKGHRSEENGPDWKGTTETTHTVTWWCVDLNQLWHVGDWGTSLDSVYYATD